MEPDEVPDDLVGAGTQALRDAVHDCPGDCDRADHTTIWIDGEPVNVLGGDVVRVIAAAVLPAAHRRWFVDLFGDPLERLKKPAKPDSREEVASLLQSSDRLERARTVHKNSMAGHDYNGTDYGCAMCEVLGLPQPSRQSVEALRAENGDGND